MRNWDEFNRGIVEEFRATGGKVTGRFANRPLMLLTTTGAKTGLARTIPLVYTTDGGRVGAAGTSAISLPPSEP